MRFRQVEAFRAAMVAGSMTGAAEMLNIAQPSASRLIADLEDSVGFKLFERTGGRLRPTTAGLEFFAAVDRAFIGLEKLEKAAETIRESDVRALTICTLPALTSSVIPGAVKCFRNTHPDVQVNLEVLHPHHILEALQAGQADLAMSVAFAEVAGVEQIPLMEVSFVCAMPADHALAAKDIIEVADFHNEDFVGLMPSVPIDWSRLDKLFESRGIKPRRRLATTHSSACYAFIAAGLGIALCEPFGAKSWLGNGVVVRPLAESVRYLYSLCLPERRKHAAATLAFIDALVGTLRNDPPPFCGPESFLIAEEDYRAAAKA